MTEYELDLDTPVRAGKGKKRRLGCSIAGWALFALLFTAVIFFGYRVWFFYGKIRKGELIQLPQFTERFTASEGGAARLTSNVADRAAVETPDNPTLGTEDPAAKLTIVLFADFECPYSKEEAPVVRTLLAKYGDKVRLIYRDFPIGEIHQRAFEASLAAECAREQGKFWAYHDKLYLNAPALDFPMLVAYAEEVGLEPRQFERCVVDQRYKEKVERDLEAARRLGLRGTPTFFFNGQKVEGAIPPQVFEQVLVRLLR